METFQLVLCCNVSHTTVERLKEFGQNWQTYYENNWCQAQTTPHCRVLPLSEFDGMIIDPFAVCAESFVTCDISCNCFHIMLVCHKELTNCEMLLRYKELRHVIAT